MSIQIRWKRRDYVYPNPNNNGDLFAKAFS